MEKQFEIEKNTVVLRVKKSPLIIRVMMFVASLGFFIGPVIGVIIAGKAHIGFFIWFVVFGLIGFYMLRIALWNSYGEERISFENNTIVYEANYGWFKDAKKTIESGKLELVSKPIGYEEDKKGVLCLETESNEIESVVKMPLEQLSILIKNIETAANNGYQQ